MPNVTNDLDTGRQIFRQLRLAGCGFSLSDSGKISTTGETPDPELLAQANAHLHALGMAISEVTALEGLLRRRVREGSSGTSIARAILEKDPVNDLAVLTLRDAPDGAAAIHAVLTAMGLTLARSAEDPDKVQIDGPAAVLASACSPTMKNAIAAHRTALLAKIDAAAVQASTSATKPKMTARTIRKNPSSAMHAIQIFHVAQQDARLGLRKAADGTIEVYGEDQDVVSQFAHDAAQGLNPEHYAVLNRLISNYPVEPKKRK